MDLARKHYATTDRNGYKRSTGDALTAFLYDQKNLLIPEQRTKLATAIRFMNSGFSAKAARGRRKLEDHELAKAIVDWTPEALEAFKIIHAAGKHIRGRMQLCPLLSVMLVTLRHNHDQAREFWESVALDSGLQRGQPEKALIIFLTSPQCGIETIGANTFARKVAAAYNAFCYGNEVEQLRAFPTRPINIHKTPLKGIEHRYYEPSHGFLTLEELQKVGLA